MATNAQGEKKVTVRLLEYGCIMTKCRHKAIVQHDYLRQLVDEILEGLQEAPEAYAGTLGHAQHCSATSPSPCRFEQATTSKENWWQSVSIQIPFCSIVYSYF